MEKVLKKDIDVQDICNKIIWYLTVSIIPAVGLFDGHVLLGRLIYGIVGLTACLILVKERLNFRPKIQMYHILITIFICICYASGIWGWSDEYPFSTSGYILRIFICMSVFYYHYEQMESVEPLLQAIKWGGYILAYCCLIGYNPRNIVEILLKGGRVYNGFLCYIEGQKVPGLLYGVCTANINLLGMFVAVPTVIGIFDIAFKRKKIVREIIYIFPALLFVVISGGKSNFLVVFLGVFLMVLLKTRHESTKKTLIRWGLLLVVCVVILYALSFIPMFQTTFYRFYEMVENLLGKRYETSTSERTMMIRVGLQQFIKTPFGGIGVDNARFLLEKEAGLSTYLHCNYVELLVGVGIIGTAAFYALYIYPMLQFWKYRRYANEHTVICSILILIILFADVAGVTYTWRVTYLYFALFFIHARKLRLKAQREYVSEKKRTNIGDTDENYYHI